MVEVPERAKLAFACAGIFLSFSYFAVLQEDVYKKPYGGEYFKYTFLALVCERGINAAIGAMGVLCLGGSGLKIPLLDILWSGTSQMFAMAGSNEALRYVSYPTQVLGKSCKMVPVMAGGLLLGGKSYTVFEYLQVVLITGGVVVFNFGGKKKGGGSADSPYGLGLIAFSLLMDAFTGGLQDKVKTSTKALNPTASGPRRPTMHESMFYTNVAGCLVALVLAILSGHLVGGIKFSMAQPEVLMAILLYSVSSAVGQNFVYFTVTEFGPLILTTVTTVRKIFSTLYSVFRTPSNTLSPMQWGGCSMVFAGLLGDIVRKMMPKPSSAPKAAPAVEQAPPAEAEAAPETPPATTIA
uniref:Uncharacterized protein n=1 Tax=Phaeocystis antarctica TaxID=33657 RepID=A0A7S0ER98_9EUKA|mmetsp:Transcript_28424/g.67037  ORF Transcript_28424/g.67037 Transcript_28424/m.67037 type:complete len:353 (+) Transcript_28424:59-1117(+)